MASDEIFEESRIILETGEFDSDWYRREYKDVQLLGMSPIEHYVRFGRRMGRQMRGQPSKVSGEYCESTHLREEKSTESKILQTPSIDRANPEIDIILPVYRSMEETLSCILHVLSQKYDTKYELIVIDDCSPEKELSLALQRIAEAKKITLLRNEENLGFTRTVNRGLALHPDRDVILLNSDTETYGNWLDRMVEIARSNPDCFSITPLTNNGEICSYPAFCKDNNLPLEVSFDELDEICSSVNVGQVVSAPTGVGFCMYLRREVLEKIGYLDAEAFGRGYGEENDLSQRAHAAGYRDLIAGNIFVRHLGGVSFQDEKQELVRRNLATLNSRYPDYQRHVMEFVQSDPVRPLREQVDLERLRRLRKHKNILVISHYNRTGGSEQAVQKEMQLIKDAGHGIFRLRASDTNELTVSHFVDGVDLPNLRPLHLVFDEEEILSLWRDLGITEVHIHHLVDFGLEAPRILGDLLTKAGISYRFFAHDYHAICPRIHLHDDMGFYCGEPTDTSSCNKCLQSRGSPNGASDILTWRSSYEALFQKSEMIVAPDNDVISRLNRYFPGERYFVKPLDLVRTSEKLINFNNHKVRVVTLGAISELKGFHVLTACATHARNNGLPLEFHVCGYTMDDEQARRSGVTVGGKYEPEVALNIIAAARPTVVFLASVVPETFSYTLSLAMQSGVPICVFDIGAPARRLRDYNWGHILPLSLAKDPAALNAELLRTFGGGTVL